MKISIYTLLLVAVFVIAFFLRFNMLGAIPLGLQQDETSIGYNAYSILQTGRDEHNESFPLYFKAFGEYKLPVSIYITTFFIQLFGLTAFAVRFPFALFGSLSVVILYFFVKDLVRNKQHLKLLPLIATTFFAFNPWHIHFSRGAFEVTIALFFLLLGTLLFFWSLQKKSYFFLFSVFCFIVALYTYNTARLFVPLWFVFLVYLYRKELLAKPKQLFILSSGIGILLLVPFLFSFFSKGGLQSAHGTLLFSSSASQAPLLEFRSYLIALPPIITKIFFNSLFLSLWQYINNIFSYFSVSYFFVQGSAHGNHGIGNVGQFYLFEFIFIIIGIISLIKEKLRFRIDFFIWTFLVIVIAAATREVPQATRSFFLVVPFTIFSAYGFIFLLKKILILKNTSVKNIVLVFGAFYIFYNLFFYFSSYYIRFPILYAKSWRAEDKTIAEYIMQNQNKYDSIIFDTNSGYIFSSLLFYTKYPPLKFQKSAVWDTDDSEGFSKLLSFDKFIFKDVDWSKDIQKDKTLIVTSNDKKPKDITPVATFYYPKRPVVLSVGQNLIQYPVEDVAYVLIEKK